MNSKTLERANLLHKQIKELEFALLVANSDDVSLYLEKEHTGGCFINRNETKLLGPIQKMVADHLESKLKELQTEFDAL